MPYDRPTKDELVNAVREFLESKVLPELDSHLGFNTRIAINVLKTVERELELGEKVSTQTRQRLLELLEDNHSEKSNRELNILLSKEIGDRKLSYKDENLVDHLWQTTMKKLAVDNPRYASYQQESDSDYWRKFYNSG
jgi:hypothetical protein